MAFQHSVAFTPLVLGLALVCADAKAQDDPGSLATPERDTATVIDLSEVTPDLAVAACRQNQGNPQAERIATLNPAELWALVQICEARPADFRMVEPGYDEPDFSTNCLRRSEYRVGPDFISIAAQAAPSKNRIDLSFFVFDDGEVDASQAVGGPWASLERQVIDQGIVLTDFEYEYSRESEAAQIDLINVVFRDEVRIGFEQSTQWFTSCPLVVPDRIEIAEAEFRGPLTINLSPYSAHVEIRDSEFFGDAVFRFGRSVSEATQAELGVALYPAGWMSVSAHRARFQRSVRVFATRPECSTESEPVNAACEAISVSATLELDTVDIGTDLEILQASGVSDIRFSAVEVENRFALIDSMAAESCDASIRPISGAVRLTNLTASSIEACLEIFPNTPPVEQIGEYGEQSQTGTGLSNVSFNSWRNLLIDPEAPVFLARSSFNHTTSPLLRASSYFEANQLSLKARDTLHEHAKLRTREAPPLLGVRSLHTTLQYEPMWTLMPFLGVIVMGSVLYGLGARSEPIGQLSLAKRFWVSLDFTLPILQLDARHERLIPQEGWVRHLIYVQRLTGAVLALYFAAVLTVLGL